MYFIYRVLKSYFFGAFPPKLTWVVTDICNSKCIFCEVPGGFKGKTDCSNERALSLCGELRRLGVREVHLVGGEVFLRKDIWEILKALKRLKIRVTITTNGLAFDSFDKEKRRILTECVDRLRFSLDSTIQEEYDRIRGVNGAFNKISVAIE